VVEGMPVGAGIGVARTSEERRRVVKRMKECILKAICKTLSWLINKTSKRNPLLEESTTLYIPSMKIYSSHVVQPQHPIRSRSHLLSLTQDNTRL
jgi:hypothetical protein